MSQETNNKRKRTRKKKRNTRKSPERSDQRSRSNRRSSRSNRSENSPTIQMTTSRTLGVTPVNYPLNVEESQREDVISFLGDLKDEFLNSLYITLGGQPNQIPSRDRLIQLIYKAINTSARIEEALEKFHQKDQEALRIILQCGGVVHKKGIIEELRNQLGGSDAEWEKTSHSWEVRDC